MSDNDRARRTPEPRANEPTDQAEGHGIADIGSRHQGSDDAATEREDTKIRRTQRGESQPREETPVGRTARDTGDTGPRSTLPGNTSETGAGSPTPQGNAPRQLPGIPGAGCTRTASSLMLMSLALAATITRWIRR